MRRRGQPTEGEHSAEDQTESLPVEPVEPCFTIEAVEGKGLGAIASCDLVLGDLVLAEQPVLSWRGDDPDGTMEKLTDKMMEEVMLLHDPSEDGEKTFEGVLFSNSFPRGNNPNAFVLFLLASRFNHSCSPNCDFTWDELTNEIRIYASTNITKGTELTIAMAELREPERERRGNLRRRYGFECICSVCKETVDGSDRRRLRMKAIFIELETSTGTDPKAGAALVEELLDLYNAEGIKLASYAKKACYYGYQFALLQGDMDLAKKWIGSAYAYSVCCHGEHHEQTQRLKRFAEEPKSHPASGKATAKAQRTLFMAGVCVLIMIKLALDAYRQFIADPSAGSNSGQDALSGKAWTWTGSLL